MSRRSLLARCSLIGCLIAMACLAGCEPPAAEHSGPTVQVDDNNFEQIVLKSDKPVMVDFWAEWCGPCQAVAPVVAELAADYEGRAVVAKLNVDTATTTAAKYAIEGIPTMIVFRGGQEVSRLVGARSKPEMAALLDSALAQ